MLMVAGWLRSRSRGVGLESSVAGLTTRVDSKSPLVARVLSVLGALMRFIDVSPFCCG